MTAIADVSRKSVAELISLSGRRAVVAGGARGLGKAIAHRFTEAGASVLIGDTDEVNARAAAKQLTRSCGVTVIATKLDVTDAASVAAAADFAADRLGGIDIWVNSAGIFPRAPLLEMSEADLDGVMNVNLRGAFLGCREAARRMIAGGNGGVLINVVSTAGFKGVQPEVAHYVASKHGVGGLTRQIALELAPHGIRALGVAPTLIATEDAMAARPQSGTQGAKPPKINCRLGRTGVPDDIARVVLFCASDLSIYMTGSTLLVDAGELL